MNKMTKNLFGKIFIYACVLQPLRYFQNELLLHYYFVLKLFLS
jgi:hypothetical protein